MLVSLRWLAEAEPRQVVRVLGVVALLVAAGAFALLAVGGRLYYLFGTLFALAPLLRYVPALWRSLRGLGGRDTGSQASQVETDILAMTLDHETGAMDGEVRAGQFKGHRLADLGERDLVALLAESRQLDTQSAALVEAYLDRQYPQWRQREQPGPGGGGSGGQHGGKQRQGGRDSAGATAGGAMTREQAYAVLGLEAGADAEAIRAAHRRLMRQVHPDAGGSDFLAAQINQAKETLLGKG